jgi:hypothetical protein
MRDSDLLVSHCHDGLMCLGCTAFCAGRAALSTALKGNLIAAIVIGFIGPTAPLRPVVRIRAASRPETSRSG